MAQISNQKLEKKLHETIQKLHETKKELQEEKKKVKSLEGKLATSKLKQHSIREENKKKETTDVSFCSP